MPAIIIASFVYLTTCGLLELSYSYESVPPTHDDFHFLSTANNNVSIKNQMLIVFACSVPKIRPYNNEISQKAMKMQHLTC